MEFSKDPMGIGAYKRFIFHQSDNFEHRTVWVRLDHVQPSSGPHHPANFVEGSRLKIDWNVVQGKEEAGQILRFVFQRQMLRRSEPDINA